MSRKHMDSATLIAQDKAEAERLKHERAAPIQPRAAMPVTMQDAQVADQHGPSIKCPAIYEALRKKGYSKEKAARISNSRC